MKESPLGNWSFAKIPPLVSHKGTVLDIIPGKAKESNLVNPTNISLPLRNAAHSKATITVGSSKQKSRDEKSFAEPQPSAATIKVSKYQQLRDKFINEKESSSNPYHGNSTGFHYLTS